MDFELGKAIDVLERTPRVLRTWLSGLDESWTHHRYGEGTFSPYHVVGHLIVGERIDWMPRVRIILGHGTARAFDPFPHGATIEPESGRPLGDLLTEFATLRAANLAELRSLRLDEAALALRGTHPALGDVTLSQLLAAWVVHDQHHTAQVAKGMSYQYRNAVGAWREYLGIIPKEP